MTEPLLYIGIVARGAIRRETHQALDRTFCELPFNRLPTDFEPAPGLVLGRNLVGARFLNHPAKPTHLLLVDDDVGGFTGEDVARMVRADVGVVGGPLPARWIDLHHFLRAIQRGVPVERLHFHLSPSLMTFVQEDGHARTKMRGDHLCEVAFVSTGFLVISREAMERVTAPPEMWCTINGKPIVRAFDFKTDERNEWVGEDVAFCRHWRALGEPVYADTRTALTHTGEVTFYAEPLEALFTASAKRPPGSPT